MEYVILGVTNGALLALLSWLLRRHRRFKEQIAPAIEISKQLDKAQARLRDSEDARDRADAQATVRRAVLEQEYAGAKAMYERIGPAVSLEAELESLAKRSKRLRDSEQEWEESAKRNRSQLEAAYMKARATHTRLTSEISVLEENLTDISFGLYEPHFKFDTSGEYKQKLTAITQRLKQMVRADTATAFSVEWTVGGSRDAGERMQRQYAKLMLRAFNGECDAAQGKVSWNNIARMEKRVQKAYEAINSLGQVMKVEIRAEYQDLCVEALRLRHEMEEKRREEKMEQRRVRDEMREERKAQQELEKAKRDAEVEETQYEKALGRARAEMEQALGKERAALAGQIEKLQSELQEAQSRKARAISRAQLTRSGHVYIISNIGSFGENVIKIGMSRRLEPLDRVRELGGASVPFGFDVHGMVYSDDAPALEAELHRQFDNCRVNPMNRRREFFHVSLPEISEFVDAKGLNLELTLLAEAKEYRQALAMQEKAREADAQRQREPAEADFPEQLFPE